MENGNVVYVTIIVGLFENPKFESNRAYVHLKEKLWAIEQKPL